MGAIAPGGILEVSGMIGRALAELSVDETGVPSFLVLAHGADVEPMGGVCAVGPDLAQGAWVPAPGMGRAAATEGMP